MIRVLQVIMCICVFLYADSEIYNKRYIKPYFSLTAAPFGNIDVDDVNGFVFGTHYDVFVNDTTGEYNGRESDDVGASYDKYDNELNWKYPILTLEAGVQYKQLLVGVNANYTFTQMSVAPATISERTETELWDTKFYTYSMGINVGWMLLSQKSMFNIIPSTSFGFTSVNITMPGKFSAYYTGSSSEFTKPYVYEKKYYTSFGRYALADLDLRLTLGQFSISTIGGYKVVRYDYVDMFTETSSDGNTFTGFNGDSGAQLDSWYIGLKLTFTMLSTYEKELLIE